MLVTLVTSILMTLSAGANAPVAKPKLKVIGEYQSGLEIRTHLIKNKINLAPYRLDREIGFFLDVPIDYGNISKGKTGIFVFTFAPFDSKKPSMIFINGGPGGNGHGLEALTDILPNWNVIHFDQRGTGFSKPATLEIMRDRDYTSSRKVAQDIESIRKHLKIDQLSVYAHSYGTTIGTIYAHLFPTTTKALILEGVMNSGEPSLWLGSHRIKRLQKFFNRLTSIEQDRILALSKDPKLSPTWFHDRARMFMYAEDFEFQLQEFLGHVLSEGADTLGLRESTWQEGQFEDSFYWGAYSFAQISCRELSMTDPSSTWSYIFHERKLVPQFDSNALEMCADLGWSSANAQTYNSLNYPLVVPVTYVNGTHDGATVAPSAIRHYKWTAKGPAQLFLARLEGHEPLHSTLGNFLKAKDRPKVIEFFEKALHGKFLTKEEAKQLPDWKFTRKN